MCQLCLKEILVGNILPHIFSLYQTILKTTKLWVDIPLKQHLVINWVWPLLQNSIVSYGKRCVIYSCSLKCVALCEMWILFALLILLCWYYCCDFAVVCDSLVRIIPQWCFTKLGHPWPPNLECDLKRNKSSTIMHPKLNS